MSSLTVVQLSLREIVSFPSFENELSEFSSQKFYAISLLLSTESGICSWMKSLEFSLLVPQLASFFLLDLTIPLS